MLAISSQAAAAPLLPTPAAPDAALAPLLRSTSRLVALIHARIVDGTGAPARQDMTLLIDHGRIAAIQPSGSPVAQGAAVMDMGGKTVLPGLVGMHEHLFYIALPRYDTAEPPQEPLLVPQMTYSAPRLYLAGGVTTIRTTGSVETYADLNLKRDIDAGHIPGPHIDVTGPYLEGPGSPFIQMYNLRDANDARDTVNFWADRGVTSFKAYMNITRAELGAAIAAAHARGIKVTGHLCSVTYTEAVDLGIDDLEHGFDVNTELDHDHAPDHCSKSDGEETLLHMDPDGPAADALIAKLVARHVAVTSTLPVFEAFFRPQTVPRTRDMLATMTPQAVAALDRTLAKIQKNVTADDAVKFRHAMQMERRFVKAGGLLLAGLDPTGAGNVVPGFGDAREVELLVEAGFTPLEAIRIATLNGAIYLGMESRIGSVEVGKDADLMVVDGDPSAKIADIERVSLVFKDGIGWDPAKLRASVAGDYGQY
jgi:imidazolonepropionase-like amidohydrolase